MHAITVAEARQNLPISVRIKRSFLVAALLSICLIVFSSTDLLATIYYVSPIGLDSNSGLSVTTPWRTVGKAVATVKAGDTIYIRVGRYFEHNYIRTSGTSEARITFEGYPGDLPGRPVLDGTGGAAPTPSFWNNLPIIGIAADYITLRGLEITNAVGSDQIKVGDSSFLILDKLVIHDGYGAGIRLYNAWNSVISNNIIYNEFAGGDTDCLSLGGDAQGSGGRHHIHHNIVAYCSDDGIDTWYGTDNIIENNTAFKTGYDRVGGHVGDGNGFKLGPPGNNIVRNNLSVSNYLRGFDYNSGTNIQLWNNDAYQNTYNYNGVTLVSGNLTVDPMFVSTDPTSPNFLRLSPNSPAIDAGINVGLPYKGSAPDIGAVEYEEVDSIPPAPPTNLSIR